MLSSSRLSVLFLISASCRPLPALSNGKIHKNDINHGALVSFSCNQGFQHKGVRQIMCIDGKWNGSSPTCKGSCHARFSYLLLQHINISLQLPLPTYISTSLSLVSTIDLQLIVILSILQFMANHSNLE